MSHAYKDCVQKKKELKITLTTCVFTKYSTLLCKAYWQ